MELEEMKEKWQEMSHELDKQKKLNDKLIIEMTQEKYNNRINRISTPEIIGSIICFGAGLIILFNFGKLDTWYLLLCGLFSLGFIFTLPALSLFAIRQMKNINFSDGSVKQTVLAFNQARNRFMFVQQLSLYLGVVLMITILPVASKIMKDEDIFLQDPSTWYWYIPMMVAFLFFFGRWGYRCYSNLTRSTEEMLQEIDR